jgi:hypothetical protein
MTSRRLSRWSVAGLAGVLLGGTVWAGNSDQNNHNDNRPMQPGLVAHYFRDAVNWSGAWPVGKHEPIDAPSKHTFTTYAYSRVEPLINHHFINEGWFSIRWVGYIDLSASAKNKGSNDVAEVCFKLWADDGCRLYVDGVCLVDSWISCWEKLPASWRTSPTVRLSDGPHRIVVEYFQGESLVKDDTDPIKLYWICPKRGADKAQIVPAAYLSHTDADLLNLTGK